MHNASDEKNGDLLLEEAGRSFLENLRQLLLLLPNSIQLTHDLGSWIQSGLTHRPPQVQGQPAWLEQGEDAQDPGRPLLHGVASWPPRARAQRHLHLLRAEHRMVLLRRQPRNRVESGKCSKKKSHFRQLLGLSRRHKDKYVPQISVGEGIVSGLLYLALSATSLAILLRVISKEICKESGFYFHYNAHGRY